MRTLFLATTAFILTACGGAPTPGTLDAELMKTARTAKGVYKAQIFTAQDGSVEKLSIYHRDASIVPEPVKALAQKTFGVPGEAFESEFYTAYGRVWEIEATTAKGKQELAAKADGTLLYIESPLTADAVPAPIMATAKAAVPGGELLEAEEKKGPSMHQYAIKMKAGDATHYMRIDPAGKMLNHGMRLPAQLEIRIK